MFFFFNDTATTEIYTLSLHDALPIYRGGQSNNAREPAQTSDRDRRRSSTADTDGDSARTGAEGKVSHRQREGLRTVRRTRRTEDNNTDIHSPCNVISRLLLGKRKRGT